MRRRRRSTLLTLAALASPAAEGKVVPRPTASRTAAADRVVDLPRGNPAWAWAGRATSDPARDDGPSSFSSSSSSSLAPTDRVSPPPSPRPFASRRLPVVDGTPDAAAAGIGRPQSRFHERLDGPSSGTVPSPSVEFTIRNHRDDGRYAIVSGLGLRVRTETPAAGAGGVPSFPCRVKVYARRDAVDTSNIEITAEAALYELALDARVMCGGGGWETLLSSSLFLKNYKEAWEDALQAGGPARRTATTTTTAGPEDRGGVGGGGAAHGMEDAAQGETVGPGVHNSGTTPAVGVGGAYGGHGLTEAEGGFPLLLPPGVALSVYVVMLPDEGNPEGTAFQLLSSSNDEAESDGPPEVDGEERAARNVGDLFASDASLSLFWGSSFVNGYLVDPDEGTGTDETGVDGNDPPQVIEPTIFNGAIYYDVFHPYHTSLKEYYEALQYSLLPGDPLPGLPGCDKEFSTGFHDTVGSYGFMFDVTSNIPPSEDDHSGGNDEDFTKRFKNVEIYGMDLYIRNPVNVSFEVHVHTDSSAKNNHAMATYTSYRHPVGQTLISENWEMIASGVVEGRGIGRGSPIPHDTWRKNVILPPGETVGFYITLKDGPDLRYRNTTVPEGNVYKSDGLLNVAVGRSWGEYPLRGDGTDVYFSPREFSGAFRYHVREGLCLSEAPSAAPSRVTGQPTRSLSPTEPVENSYAGTAEERGMCAVESALETTFEDGTGSYGGLFDVLAKTDLTLTGIDLNIDWNTGPSAHVLIYARKGSWFGHQNNADSWPHLIVNTTLHRPLNFHNRSKDGPYIPTASKMSSAIVPRNHFKPLEMKIGETWSLYICTNQADFRYTLGTSIGKTFASNPELRIMEGAGAADYPPFHGGTPEAGGVEYTFYAPRVFNGQLRYDHVAECASEPPSSFSFTPVPTAIPTLTTSVSYTFYVEHSSDKLKGAVTYDMEFGVRAVLDRFLDGDEDILYGYKKKHGLTIEGVVAHLVSPTEIGYLCYPTPPDTCTPISVDVTATHLATATTDEVEFALLRQSMHLPRLIDVDGYTIEYVGDRAVETSTGITLSNVPDRLMMDVEREFFEEVAREFLDQIAVDQDIGNDSLRVLSVKVDGQEIVSGAVIPTTEDATKPSVLASLQKRNNSGRRMQNKKKSNNVKVSVKGKYRPPPEVDFGKVVENSINRDRELLEKGLKDRDPPPQNAAHSVDNNTYSNYFDDAEVVVARQIREKKGLESLGALNYRVKEEGGMTYPLNLVAMGVGGAIVLLSLAFLLRPHRWRAMFSSGYKDGRAHRSTARVDDGDGDRFIDDGNALRRSTKHRAMIRGESLGDSDDSFPKIGSEQAAFNPRGSHMSDTNLRFSDFSVSGPQGGFDPRPLNGSFTRRPMSGSFTMSQDMQLVPFGPKRGRNNSVPPKRPHHGPPQGSFLNHNSMPPMRSSMRSSFQSGPMGGGPPPECGRMQNHELLHRSFQSGPINGHPPLRGIHPVMADSGRHLMGVGPPQTHHQRRSLSPRPEYGYR